MTQIDRIRQMEECLDASAAAVEKLGAALKEYEAVQKQYKKLSDYYGSPRWMKDFEDDEAGLLPDGLKRGVLSEDGIWNLLSDCQELQILLKETAEKTLA